MIYIYCVCGFQGITISLLDLRSFVELHLFMFMSMDFCFGDLLLGCLFVMWCFL
jgi:hypothetical protein